MRQIRHAIMDSLRKVYTNRKLWFWTVRPSHSERIPIFNWHFLAFSFSFDVCWNQIGISVIWKLPMETLSNFSFLCEVSIWLCLIVWLCQILDAVRLRPTFDVVRSSMNLIQGEVRFWKRTILLLFQKLYNVRKYLLGFEIQNNNLSCLWKLSSNVLTIKPRMPLDWEERGNLFFLLCRSFKFSSLKLLFSEPNLSTLFWSGRKPKKRFLWGMGNIFRPKEAERVSFCGWKWLTI